MTTKFRKRALLSSVAMLLVAMLALGTATFAWYTQNMTVSATGMELQTTTSSGLLITSDTKLATVDGWSWADNTTWTAARVTAAYGNTTTMTTAETVVQPVNIAAVGSALAWYQATAGSESLSAADTSVDTTADTSGANFISEKLYFKLDNGTTNSGDVLLTSVTIDQDALTATIKSAVRVAVVSSAGNVLYVGAPASSAETVVTGAGTYSDNTTSVTYPAVSDDTAYPNTAVVTGISKTPSNAKYVTVYVFLDGSDTNASTANGRAAIGSELLNSITLGFTLTNVA